MEPLRTETNCHMNEKILDYYREQRPAYVIYDNIYIVEMGFLCVTVLAVLELALVDQADLELTEIHLPLPSRCWD